MARLHGERSVAVYDCTEKVAGFEARGRPVGVQRGCNHHIIGINCESLRVNIGRLLVPTSLEFHLCCLLHLIQLLDARASLARGAMIGIEAQRLRKVLERRIRLSRGVQRLTAHDEQIRDIAEFAKPACRLADDLRRALLGSGTQQSLHHLTRYRRRARAALD